MTGTEIQGGRRAVFASLLFVAMGIAILPPASLAILASFIIDDLGITRAQLGLAAAVINVSAAALSPVVGRITDRIGGRAALLVLFAVATLFYSVYGVAGSYVMLLIGGLAGAYSVASANPSTNKLIADLLPAGERGVTTGVKQSGVQAAIFLAGITLPSVALAWGWHAAYLIVATIPLAFLILTPRVIRRPPPPTPGEGRTRERLPLPTAIWWLAVYGFLMGFSGAVTFLVPLFADEALGLGPRVAGVIAAIIGLVGAAGRILWGRYAERRDAYRRTLGLLALISIGAAFLFFLADQTLTWLVWPAAVAFALGSSSWNSVGMLAVISSAGPGATGRASGVVLLAFLAGLGLGPPLFGRIVDTTGSYDPMWLLSAISALLALLLIAAWGRTGSVALQDR